MGFLFALQFIVPVAIGAYLVWKFVLNPFFRHRLDEDEREATSQRIREKLWQASNQKAATRKPDVTDKEIDQAIEELNEDN